MTRFTIASFNVKNLIGPDQEFYQFLSYTPEEYAWKRDWMADQLLTLDADIVGFQEIFTEDSLRDVITETDRRGRVLNDAALPDPTKDYRKKVIFRKLAYTPMTMPSWPLHQTHRTACPVNVDPDWRSCRALALPNRLPSCRTCPGRCISRWPHWGAMTMPGISP